MAAPKGNRFWEARSSHGRNPIFASADDLWNACCEYFAWAEDNPLWETKLFSYQGDVTEGVVPKMRAMTIGGMCIFLGVDRRTWFAWRDTEDFSHVVARVDEIIRDQKFSGAAADLLNPNIIARDLGLSDKLDHQSSDRSMTPAPAIDASKLSTDALKELIAAASNNAR